MKGESGGVRQKSLLFSAHEKAIYKSIRIHFNNKVEMKNAHRLFGPLTNSPKALFPPRNE